MTSKWTTSAPAASTLSTSSPSRAKLADRIEGAIKKWLSLFDALQAIRICWRPLLRTVLTALNAAADARMQKSARNLNILRRHVAINALLGGGYSMGGECVDTRQASSWQAFISRCKSKVRIWQQTFALISVFYVENLLKKIEIKSLIKLAYRSHLFTHDDVDSCWGKDLKEI